MQRVSEGIFRNYLIRFFKDKKKAEDFISEVKNKWEIDELDVYEVLEPADYLRKWMNGRITSLLQIAESSIKKHGTLKPIFIDIFGDFYVLIPYVPWLLEHYEGKITCCIKFYISPNLSIAIINIQDFVSLCDAGQKIEEIVYGK